MGDSETVVAQTSIVMEYASAGYTAAAGYGGDTGSNVVSDSSAYSTEGTGAFSSSTGATYPMSGYTDAKLDAGVENTNENAAVTENVSVAPPQTASYSSSINGNIVGEAGIASAENGTAADTAGEAVAGSAQQFVDGSVAPLSGEEERLWNIVKANSLEFDAWTALIDETEKVAGDKILKIRKVYDAFLAEFPLCYGYWKKYADHEARIGSMDKVVEVYERAVLGVTYSVDIWLHYCVFAISTYEDPETIRRLFERGLAYVGTDYLAYPLWDKYIEYEEMRAEWSRVAMIYTRILEIPNKRLDDYFNRFKAFAASHTFSELRTAEEAAGSLPASSAGGDQANEDEVLPDATEQSSKPEALLSHAAPQCCRA